MREWIKQFEENKGKSNITKYLLGNKSDLENKINEDKINKFLQEVNFKFKKVSALTGNNIEELFKGIAEDMFEVFF